MAQKFKNLDDFLAQPGQTKMDLMRKFNKARLAANMNAVSTLTFYSWCRGDWYPTKDWDKNTLSDLTGIPVNRLWA